MADHAPIIFLARRQSPARGFERAAGQRLTRLGLGDIGAGDIADLEAVARCLEVGAENLDLILIQFDDRAVADHVHVGADRFGEDVAFDRTQGRPPGLDAGLGGGDRIADAAAAEQRVAEVDPAAEIRPLAEPAQRPALGQVAVDPDRRRNLRSSGGTRDRDRRIIDLQRLALAGQGRVGAIGVVQRFAKRVGGGRSGDQCGEQGTGQKVTLHDISNR